MTRTLEGCTLEEQHSVNRFSPPKPSEILSRMFAQNGRRMNSAIIYRCGNRFRSGLTNVSNEPRSGSPVEMSVPLVKYRSNILRCLQHC